MSVWTSPLGSVAGLVQAQHISVRVLEPGRLLGAQHTHMVNRLQSRQVVVGEGDAPALQIPYLSDDVRHGERQFCAPGRFGVRAWHQCQSRSATEGEYLLAFRIAALVIQAQTVP